MSLLPKKKKIKNKKKCQFNVCTYLKKKKKTFDGVRTELMSSCS
jgi:hypothetical protein